MRALRVVSLLLLATVGGGWYLLHQNVKLPASLVQTTPQADAQSQAAEGAKSSKGIDEKKPTEEAASAEASSSKPATTPPPATPDSTATAQAPANQSTPASSAEAAAAAATVAAADSSQNPTAAPGNNGAATSTDQAVPVSTTASTPAPADKAAEQPAAGPDGYVSLYKPGEVGHAEATLCYFSFNREVEFTTVHNLVNQMNEHSPIKIKVVELIANDENIKKAISDAVESGISCDGVVMTGHHHGKFWGDRTSGSVKAKFIEELSCDSRYAAWFARVKALWLEGCHTGTVNPYNDEVKSGKKLRGSPVGMMRSHLDYDDVRGSCSDMEDVIEDNLADENIANDYQRIFPYATIFGWSGYAPGEKAGSHYSFPYHIAQVSHLVDPADEYFKDPMHGKLPDIAAHRYSEVLYGMLKRPNFGGGSDWPTGLNEANYIKGWYNHGDFRKKFSLDNGALVTRKALVNSDTELLRQSRALRCVAYQDRSPMKAPGGVVAYLTKNESLTPFASELLLAMLQSGSGVGAETKERLSHNDTLRGYLSYTAGSAQASEFRKADAEAFLTKLGAAPPAQQATPDPKPDTKADAKSDVNASSKPDPKTDQSQSDVKADAKTDVKPAAKPSQAQSEDKSVGVKSLSGDAAKKAPTLAARPPSGGSVETDDGPDNAPTQAPRQDTAAPAGQTTVKSEAAKTENTGAAKPDAQKPASTKPASKTPEPVQVQQVKRQMGKPDADQTAKLQPEPTLQLSADKPSAAKPQTAGHIVLVDSSTPANRTGTQTTLKRASAGFSNKAADSKATQQKSSIDSAVDPDQRNDSDVTAITDGPARAE